MLLYRPYLQPQRVFDGGNQTAASMYEFMEQMSWGDLIAPTAGGTLTVNSASLGSYDYAIAPAQPVTTFTNTDWFTATADSRSALIAVKGSLNIPAGQTFIPSNRKLFTCIYVDGDLTVGGSLSMSARGSNHSAGGGNVTAAAIRIITGTYSGVVDPNVPAAGGGGGTAVNALVDANTTGTTGTAGATGGCGGGGAGGANSSNAAGNSTSGAGTAGTSFTGGTGGGGCRANNESRTATAGSASGASGGAGNATDAGAGGGAGNPGGALSGTGAVGGTGTGGVLVVIVRGNLLGAGTVVSAGAAGGTGSGGGGGSGGGSITILYRTDGSSITPTALGGAGGAASATGGAGGAGTARKLALGF